MVKQKIKIELPTSLHSKYIVHLTEDVRGLYNSRDILIGEGDTINEAMGDLFLQLIDADKINFEVVKLPVVVED